MIAAVCAQILFNFNPCEAINDHEVKLASGCLFEAALLAPTSAVDRGPTECGLASVYSSASEETASGEDTLPDNFTAAHRTLPFGTLVHVNNPENERWAVVRITDRGPFISGRIIDVSQAAARDLGISGLTQVCLNMPGSRPVGQK